MTREHISSHHALFRPGLGAIALAAALAVTTSACQSSSSKAANQDPAGTTASTTASTSASAATAGSSSASAGASTSSSGADAKPSAPTAGGNSHLGTPMKSGDFTVTVRKVQYPYSSGMDTPDNGKALVVLDVEVANNTSQTRLLSGLMQFSVKDSTGKSYDETILLDAGKTPEGDIPAGKSLRGPVGFEVPAGAKGLTFSFEGDTVHEKSVQIPLGV